MSGYTRWISQWQRQLGEENVRVAAPMADYTTLRVGGPADVVVTVTSVKVLVDLARQVWAAGEPLWVLGGGSNVLVADEGIRGVVVINRCRGYEVFTTPDGIPYVRAEAGVPLAGLARSLIRQGLDGLTWAVNIPGTVGGAVVGNAGAHGGAVADVLVEVVLLERDGTVRRLPATAMAYSYRSSWLKARGWDRPLVLEAVFRLSPASPGVLQRQAETFVAYRRQTQPSEPSVGSIFQNPEGDFAGRLIEAAGLKGARCGNAMISPVHANFIVNLGGARAADVETLMRRARETVKAHFGITLKPEILFLGEWPSDVCTYWGVAPVPVPAASVEE